MNHVGNHEYHILKHDYHDYPEYFMNIAKERKKRFTWIIR